MTQGNYTDEMRSDEIRWPSACWSRGGGESVGGGGEEFKNDRYWENCLFKDRDPLGNVTAFLLVLVNVVNFLLIKSLIDFPFFQFSFIYVFNAFKGFYESMAFHYP